MPNFHIENPATCHLAFPVEIRHHFALGDTEYDNHTKMGASRYIYTYIMLNTQLDLFCSDNISCADPNTQLNHQLEKDIGSKVLQFITR